MKQSKSTRKMINTTVSFKFPMTSDEAHEVLKNKNGKVAKKFRKYLNDVLVATAHKCLEELKKVKERELIEDTMSV